jgi:hypothetical protein
MMDEEEKTGAPFVRIANLGKLHLLCLMLLRREKTDWR